MKFVKFTIFALAIVGLILSFTANMLSFGADGAIVLAGCALPAALAAYGTVVRRTMPRWAAAVSAISFLLVGFKTVDSEALDNIMMASFVGMLLAIVLTVRPERS